MTAGAQKETGDKSAAKAAAVPAATRDRILDAAEHLFGERAFDAVALRDIAALAGVNFGLVHYHFRTKDALLEQVVARRAEPVTRARRGRLGKSLARGDVRLEEIVDAYTAPLVELMLSREPGGAAYARLLTQIGGSNRWHGLVETYFDSTAQLFLGEIRKLLRDVPEERLLYGFNYLFSSMLHTVSTHRRIDTLSGGAFSGGDVLRAYPYMIAFICAGLRGVAAEPEVNFIRFEADPETWSGG
jgi:AcrR family transcriptional regulator